MNTKERRRKKKNRKIEGDSAKVLLTSTINWLSSQDLATRWRWAMIILFKQKV